MDIIFDFSAESDLGNWEIVNDGVMGGLSDGDFSISKEGNGVFEGEISLENNGGFSSVQHYCGSKEVSKYVSFLLHIKGDGKPYQFRAKSRKNDKHSYIYTFETTAEWQTIKIPMNEMVAQYRGQKLPMPNYNGEQLEQITFLFGNKKAESFRLEIDKIEME